MSQQALEVLKKARDILEDPKAWTKDFYAGDGNGNPVPVSDLGATCFCSLGATMRASKDLGHPFCGRQQFEAEGFLGRAMGGYVANRNDAKDTEHLHILMSFDLAILMAEDELQVPA